MKKTMLLLLTREAKQLFKAANRIDRVWRRLIVLHRKRLIAPEITTETQTAWDVIYKDLQEFIVNFGEQLQSLEEGRGVPYFINRETSMEETQKRALKDLKTLGQAYEVPRMYSLYGKDFLYLSTKLDMQLKVCENYMFMSPHAVFALDRIREGFLEHYERIYRQVHQDDGRYLRIMAAVEQSRKHNRKRQIYV